MVEKKADNSWFKRTSVPTPAPTPTSKVSSSPSKQQQRLGVSSSTASTSTNSTTTATTATTSSTTTSSPITPISTKPTKVFSSKIPPPTTTTTSAVLVSTDAKDSTSDQQLKPEQAIPTSDQTKTVDSTTTSTVTSSTTSTMNQLPNDISAESETTPVAVNDGTNGNTHKDTEGSPVLATDGEGNSTLNQLPTETETQQQQNKESDDKDGTADNGVLVASSTSTTNEVIVSTPGILSTGSGYASSGFDSGIEDYNNDATTPTNVMSRANGIMTPRKLAAAGGNEKAESIRARLRNQEQRLSQLVSSRRTSLVNGSTVDENNQNTNDGIGGDKTMLNEKEIQQLLNDKAIEEVRENLRQVAAEKAELESKYELLQLQHAEEEAKRQEEISQTVIARSQKTLESIKFSDEHDAFLRSKLAGIQKGFSEQNIKLQQLQDTIISKDSEINMLQLELYNKIKTIIDLEYDVTCHSIHYTEYSQQQYQLGNDAMKELNEFLAIEKQQSQQQQQRQQQQLLLDDNESHAGMSTDSTWMGSAAGNHNQQQQQSQQQLSSGTVPVIPTTIHGATINPGMPSSSSASIATTTASESVVSTATTILNPRRAKKLISKLLADLDHLEDLYKNEKLKAIQLKNNLQQENEQLSITIQSLEIEKLKLQQDNNTTNNNDSLDVSENRKSSKRHRNKTKPLPQSQITNDNNDGGGNSTDEQEEVTLSTSSFDTIEHLRKRIQVLEAVRFLYRKEIYTLQEQLRQQKELFTNESNKHSIEITRLQLAYETIQRRCNILQTDVLGNSDHSSIMSSSHYSTSPNHQNNLLLDDGISALGDDDNTTADDHSSQMNQNHPNKPPYLINAGTATMRQTTTATLGMKGGQKQRQTSTSNYTAIEKRMIDCYNTIGRLEADSEIKDLQIIDLKREIYQLRHSKIATGQINELDDGGSIDPELYTENDTTILSSMDDKVQKLRSIVYTDEEVGKELHNLTKTTTPAISAIPAIPAMSSTTSHSKKLEVEDRSGHTEEITETSYSKLLFDTSATDMSLLIDDGIVLETNLDTNSAKTSLTLCVHELRTQLAVVKKELAEKDQELLIEKAKSSCMAANLLDRIEALDKELEDDSSDSNTVLTNAIRETDEEDDDNDDDNNDDNDNNNGNKDAGKDIDNEQFNDSTSGKGKKGNNKKEKNRKKIFGRIPLRFYL